MLESAPDIWPDSCCNLSSSLLVHYYMDRGNVLSPFCLWKPFTWWKNVIMFICPNVTSLQTQSYSQEIKKPKINPFYLLLVHPFSSMHGHTWQCCCKNSSCLSSLYADHKNTKKWQFPARVALQRQKRPFFLTPALLLPACVRSRTHTARWISSVANGKLITLYGRLDFCSISFWKQSTSRWREITWLCGKFQRPKRGKQIT